MLKVIQQFEPSGVGARDLRECLLIQLEDKKQTPAVANAIRSQVGYEVGTVDVCIDSLVFPKE